MKHTLKITLLLVVIFLLAQIAGLFVINAYIDHKATEESGKVVFEDLPYGMEPPNVSEGSSFWYIFAAILIGTGIIFLIIRFRRKINIVGWILLLIGVILDGTTVVMSFSQDISLYSVRIIIDVVLLIILIKFRKEFDLWKVWFLLAVMITLALSFSAFVPQYIGLIIALVLALWKVFKPNIIVHNITEIFIYGGLASIFVQIMDLTSAFMLLALISVYDMIAVWKSKHMIKMAEFQTESKLFAGLSIPYKKEMPGKKIIAKKAVSGGSRTAILGGGDIGFPLLFAGVVMKGLMLENTILVGFLKSLIIPVFTAIALFILLIKGKENQFYPAMPFLTMGCLVGYLVVLVL